MKLTRLLFPQVHLTNSPEDNGKLVYNIEVCNPIMNLWAKHINLQDNDAISIGPFLPFPCPMPIQQYTRSPHFSTPCHPLEDSMNTHRLNRENESNTALGLIHRGAIEKPPLGLLCDFQRVSNWYGRREYDCYRMSNNSSSLVVQHALEDHTITGGNLVMNNFS